MEEALVRELGLVCLALHCIASRLELWHGKAFVKDFVIDIINSISLQS
jgi:hypothetical protein